MSEWINKIIEEKKSLLDLLETSGYLDEVEKIGKIMIDALKNGKKIMTAGNGGSAADAQHFTGEIVGRFLLDRRALAAMTLCVDPAVVTAVSNDYEYVDACARQLDAVGNEGDIFLAISTSGNSKNLLKAIEFAKEKKITVIGLLGKEGGEISKVADYSLIVPHDQTPRIQETHTLTVHLLCQMIEQEMAK